MKIRAKFGLFASLLVLFATGTFAAMAFLMQTNIIVKNLDEARVAKSNGFASVCRQALTVDNDLFMINYVKLLQESPDVDYAYFVDSNGKILVHTDKRFIYKTLDQWAANKPPDVFEISVPVQSAGSSRAGRSVIGFSERFKRQALERVLLETLRNVAAAAGGIALFGLMAALLFAYFLTRPLKLLSKSSEEIAKGNFKTTVTVATRDEFGDLAQRFNQMARSLSVLDEMKDEFISNVSHDLRSPLAAIKMHLEYMLSEDPDNAKLLPKHKDLLLTIMDNALRLGTFVTNILDATKMKAGRMKYTVQPVAFEPIARNILSLYEAVARKHQISLQLSLSPDLPPIMADPMCFEQVVTNLVSNALKFTRKGGTVVLGAERQNGRVQIYVADTGKGIPQDRLDQMFQRFSQLNASEPGTGLGLSIAKDMVVAMGGEISVVSEMNKGSRFDINMPCG